MNSEQIKVYCCQGQQFLSRGDYPASIEAYLKALELDPSNAEVYILLAEAYIYNQEIDPAISALEKAVELQPDLARAYVRVGNALQRCNCLDLAIWAYTECLELQPDYSIAYSNLAGVYYQQQRWNEAINCYKKCLEITPNIAIVHWMLGNALVKSGDISGAITCYQQAINLQPNRPEFYLKMGESLAKNSQINEAIAYYKTALTLDANNSDISAKIAQLKSQLETPVLGSISEPMNFREDATDSFDEQGVDFSGQVLEGELHYQEDTQESEDLVTSPTEQLLIKTDEKLVAEKPINPRVLSLQKQAELYLSQGKLEETVATCQEILKLDPNFLLVYVVLGNALHFQGKISSAIRAYNQALEIHPSFAEVHANLATMYLQNGQVNEAIAAYKKSLEIKPDLAAVHWNLGRAYQKLGNTEAAIDSWKIALELKPDLVEAEFNFEFGNILARRGEYEQAIASYQRAISRKPDWAEPYANIGCLRVQQDRLEEALEQLQKAISLNPQRPEIYLHTARIFTKMRRHEDAINHYQKVIELKPNFADAYANLANMQATIGQLPEAIANYQKTLQLKPEWAEVYCRLAHIQKQKDPKEAVAHLEKALELQPDFAEAYQQLCDLLSHSTNLGKAREVADRYWENCGKTVPVLCAIAYIFSYTQSGACEQALVKLEELIRICNNRIETLTQIEIRLIYEIILFTVPHLRDNLEGNAQFYRIISQHYYQKPIGTPPSIYAEPRSPLKIGFLSKHFRRHSVGWCAEGVIKEMSAITPHINLYISGIMHPDEVTARYEKIVAKCYWPKSYPNGFASPEELNQEIRGDRIDVLVDLDSVTVPVNVQVLHKSPAPVCVTWLGFDAPYLTSNHYLICDQHSHPPGIEKHYLERLVRLPDTAVAIAGLPTRPVDRNMVRQQLNIPPNAVAYLCVAPGRKTNREMIKAQVNILRSVPNSVLIRKGQGDAKLLREMYNQACEDLGVALNRLIFLGLTQTEEEHRAIYKVADVMLDSYPYNGGTHNLEALWSELPVVTRSGRQYLSRMGYAFLKAVNLDIGVGWSWEEYTQLGIEFGQNAALRQQISNHLARVKQPETLAPLWNPKQLAAQMYRTFEQLRHVTN